MSNYIKKALIKYQHPTLAHLQHSPHKHTPIMYGQQIQHTLIDNSPHSMKKKYTMYKTSWECFSTVHTQLILPLLTHTHCYCLKPSKRDHNRTTSLPLLDCVTTHSHATICYSASNMILAIHTNALYLSQPKAKSMAAAHFYFTKDYNRDFNNGTILTLSTIIKNFIASASKAELVALFYGYKHGILLRTALEEMKNCNNECKSPQTTSPLLNLPWKPCSPKHPST